MTDAETPQLLRRISRLFLPHRKSLAVRQEQPADSSEQLWRLGVGHAGDSAPGEDCRGIRASWREAWHRRRTRAAPSREAIWSSLREHLTEAAPRAVDCCCT